MAISNVLTSAQGNIDTKRRENLNHHLQAQVSRKRLQQHRNQIGRKQRRIFRLVIKPASNTLTIRLHDTDGITALCWLLKINQPNAIKSRAVVVLDDLIRDSFHSPPLALTPDMNGIAENTDQGFVWAGSHAIHVTPRYSENRCSTGIRW
ncbi:hypothetical protein VI06_03400 [Aquitalea magnusonii]|nr:hypothetical protein VI06_03400 [Aquitalea magnusonii]